MADEALTAGAVARRLGVAVTTLRTWHQRYGLGPSQHIPGHHRRYTADDLTRLDTMRRLTAEGVAPAEAARWARRAATVPAAGPAPGTAGPTDRSGAAAPGPVPDDTGRPPAPGTRGSRHGGGRTIPVGRAGPAARGLARAAMRLDAPAIREILERSIATTGVIATWDDVIVPVLIGIGQRHAATRQLIEVEHLVSRGVSEVLGAVPRPPAASGAPRILLACADEEQHSLPLEALAAALAAAGAGAGCRQLGARVPPNALADAVARTGPAAGVVWSQLPPTGDPRQLAPLFTGPHRPLLVVAAGPGWHRTGMPAGITAPGSLAEAVRLVLAAAGPAAQAGPPADRSPG